MLRILEVVEHPPAPKIVVEDFRGLGRAFRETDLAEADHNTIVRNIISGAKRFIDRHVTPGAKRPPAPSVLRDRISRRARRREDGSTSPVGIVILARWASGKLKADRAARLEAELVVDDRQGHAVVAHDPGIANRPDASAGCLLSGLRHEPGNRPPDRRPAPPGLGGHAGARPAVQPDGKADRRTAARPAAPGAAS
jgi:hypothetical protein